MASTPILPFAKWLSGTNSNSVPANDNSLRNQILNGNVISQSVTAQPASPADGDIYILAGTHTGSQWAAFSALDLVIYSGGTWYAFAPVAGVVVNVAGSLYAFASGAWSLVSAGGGGGGGGSTGAGTNADSLYAYLNTATNTGTGGWQKVPIDTVSYDTNSIWDATNKRAKPKKAGYYLVTARVRTGTTGTITAGLAFNGTQVIGVGPDTGTTVINATGGTALMYFNGSSDYVEAFAYATSARALTTGTFDTYLQVVGPVAGPTSGININSQSAAYTFALTDANAAVYHPPADTTARIWTIPANSSVPFPIGTAITIDNDFGAGALTIAITTDTLVLVGASGSTGGRTIASGGQATIVKVSATRWRINGTAVS